MRLRTLRFLLAPPPQREPSAIRRGRPCSAMRRGA
jgi:hypothetical protein